MSVNDELNPRGAVFESIFNKANTCFINEDYEESERLCRLLLTYADLGDYHKAGCHFVLGMGTDNYVWHAEQAVDLYENLFAVRPGGSWSGTVAPTTSELEYQKMLLAAAKESLANAQKDHDNIRKDYERQFARFREVKGREPTDHELVTAHFNRTRRPVDEYYAILDQKVDEYLQSGVADEGGNDEEDDDGLPTLQDEPFDETRAYKPVEGGLGHGFGKVDTQFQSSSKPGPGDRDEK